MLDGIFPTTLWSKYIRQVQDTSNIIHASRVHCNVSAFCVLDGAFDFNKAPYAPPSTGTTIFNPPETISYSGLYILGAWYINPA